jgi:hypothetical protein
MKKDYDLLARAVACEYCGAEKGEPCRGARGKLRKGTHYRRRALATRLRREALKKAARKT